MNALTSSLCEDTKLGVGNQNFINKDAYVWFWTEGYHGEEICSKEFYDSKANYIHQNPVRAGIVEKEEEYLNSSCGEICGVRKGEIGVRGVLIDLNRFLFVVLQSLC